MSAGVLVHFNPDGTREEIKVDFKAILEGRHPDVSVRPNDIVFIPGSAGKTIGYGLLGAIPGMAGQRAVDEVGIPTPAASRREHIDENLSGHPRAPGVRGSRGVRDEPGGGAEAGRARR